MNLINFYLIGVAIATIITIIILATKNKVYLTDILESLVNIAGSWILILSCFVKIIKALLQAKGKNIVLWQKKENTTKQKIVKMKKK